MRHKVVHDYLGVDDDVVWQVATKDLPQLVSVLELLVPPAPPLQRRTSYERTVNVSRFKRLQAIDQSHVSDDE
jgi:hypothetical protein